MNISPEIVQKALDLVGAEIQKRQAVNAEEGAQLRGALDGAKFLAQTIANLAKEPPNEASPLSIAPAPAAAEPAEPAEPGAVPGSSSAADASTAVPN